MKNTAKLFKALSDETRLRIVKLLQHKSDLCVCEIMQALDISQPRASRNLGILREAGVVASRRTGLWVEYYLDKKGMDGMTSSILRLLQRSVETDEILKVDVKRLKRACRVGPKAAAKCRRT